MKDWEWKTELSIREKEMRKLSQTKFNYDTRFPMFNGNNWFGYNVKRERKKNIYGKSVVVVAAVAFLQWDTREIE